MSILAWRQWMYKDGTLYSVGASEVAWNGIECEAEHRTEYGNAGWKQHLAPSLGFGVSVTFNMGSRTPVAVDLSIMVDPNGPLIIDTPNLKIRGHITANTSSGITVPMTTNGGSFWLGCEPEKEEEPEEEHGPTPKKNCNCGIYAMKSPTGRPPSGYIRFTGNMTTSMWAKPGIQTGPSVYHIPSLHPQPPRPKLPVGRLTGLVHLFGRMQEHKRGWRAQKARVAAFVVMPGYGPEEKKLTAHCAEKFEVPCITYEMAQTEWLDK